MNLEIQAFAPYLVTERGFKKIALIYVDDPAGEAIKKELDAAIPKLGGMIVTALQVPRASQQISGIAAKVRDNGVTQQMASYSAFSVPTVLQLPEVKGALFPT